MLFALIFVLGVHFGQAQNISVDKIHRIENTPKAIYYGNRLIHNGPRKLSSALTLIRRSYKKSTQTERIVLVFNSKEAPRVYGHNNSAKRSIRLSLFKTALKATPFSAKKSQLVDKIHLYPMREDYLSLELGLKVPSGAEIFELSNPGRVVIDLKKR